MRKTTLIVLIIGTSFLSGFAFKTILISQDNKGPENFKKVTGIGGIFFKCKDPNKLKEWYKVNLRKGVSITDSIQTVEYGKFVHILDPEGNKLELWEANDVEYEKLGKQLGATTTK